MAALTQQSPTGIPMRRYGDPTKTPQVLGIRTCGVWSDTVDFEPCDEYRVTVSGPAASNPKIRIVLMFRERQ